MSGSARNEQVRARLGFDALFPDREGETPVQDVEGFLHLAMQMGHGPTAGGAAGELGEREGSALVTSPLASTRDPGHAEIRPCALVRQSRYVLCQPRS